jgi:hypothetical protein
MSWRGAATWLSFRLNFVGMCCRNAATSELALKHPHAHAVVAICVDLFLPGKMLRAERMPDRQFRAVGPLAKSTAFRVIRVSNFTSAQFPK